MSDGRQDRSSAVREFLTCLSAARRSSQLYPPEHPAVRHAVDDLKAVLERLLAGAPAVSFTFFEGDLVFEDRVMTRESVVFDQFIRDVNALGIDSIEVERGVAAEELTRAARILAADVLDVEASGGIERMIDAANLRAVRFGRVRPAEPDAGWSEGAERAREAYDNAVDLIREVDGLVSSGARPSAVPVKSAVSGLVEGVLQRRTAMLELTALRDYDEYTFYHSANVAILSLGIGSMITHEPRFLTSLGTGALLHDVGKLAVDRKVLDKPGSLTPEEWHAMRAHPVTGARIVSAVPGLDRSAVVSVLEHHMAYDGSGYPERAAHKGQHLASRIVAVADAYDAMTSRRCYSTARPQAEAMRLIAESAGHSLDPVLVRLFVTMLGVYPPRSVVRLGDGRTAVVVRPGDADPLRPVVRLVASADGELVESYLLDLSGPDAPAIAHHIDAALLNIEVDDYL